MLFDPAQLEHYPVLPGVYLMIGVGGDYLYIGKAKNLRQRLRQYFAKEGDGRVQIPYLVAKVAAIKTIVVDSEKEAFFLERTLIAQHKPRYNIQLRDDKNYYAFSLDQSHPYPALELVRLQKEPKKETLYFGPFLHAQGAHLLHEALQSYTRFRTCSDSEFAKRQRPCILHAMGRCTAPCVGLIDQKNYLHGIQELILQLKGQKLDALNWMISQREEKAATLEFEAAAVWQKTIEALEELWRRQKVLRVEGKAEKSLDVWAVAEGGDLLSIAILHYRGGKLVDLTGYLLPSLVEESSYFLASLLDQYYLTTAEEVEEIIVPWDFAELTWLKPLIEERIGRKVEIIVPQKGRKKELLELACKNANGRLIHQYAVQAVPVTRIQEQIQEVLGLKMVPRRIECLDISHLSGTEAVGATVVFVDGKEDKKSYRSYKIKIALASDDYGAMREVIQRRFSLDSGLPLPDLLLIDGGKGQLSTVFTALQEAGIITVDLVALCKEEGRHDKGLRHERLLVLGRRLPVSLSTASPPLLFLQKIRDEAHRFVIAYQKKRRSRQLVATQLTAIEGIGPKKAQRLLTAFGSVEAVRQATDEQILVIGGITKKDLIFLRSYYNK